jgi:biotin synthase-like enzyme
LYDKAKKDYDNYKNTHSQKYNYIVSESAYQDSVSVLKKLRKDMEVEAEKEGISIPVLLWPKK